MQLVLYQPTFQKSLSTKTKSNRWSWNSRRGCHRNQLACELSSHSISWLTPRTLPPSNCSKSSLILWITACREAEVYRLLNNGFVVPLLKKDNGIRPLVVCSILRALVGKCLLKEGQGDLWNLSLQLGLGFSQWSIHTAVHAARSWARDLGVRVMVKVDIKNAFGTISRQAIMHGISLYAPIFARWAACSLRPTSVFYGELALEITTGVQQGDPLAPVFFSRLGSTQWLLKLETNAWYLDDALTILTTGRELNNIQLLKWNVW